MTSTNESRSIAEMMDEICDKLGIQIIMVTHSETLAEISDHAFVIGKRGSHSKVSI